MANLSDYAEQIVLDFLFRGSTAAAPTSWGLALSTSSPTASTFTEIGTGSGYQRQTMPLAAEASPAGSNSNTAAATFGPFSSACTILAAAIFNTVGTGGSVLVWNTLSAAKTMSAGETLSFPVGTITNAII